MKELADYSGEFKPDLSFEDFSKEALVRLLTEYARVFLATDGYWYTLIRNRHGDEEALACEKIVWERTYTYDPRRITQAMNIQGKDVAACMKALRLSPGFPIGVFDYRIELKNPNHAILTVTHCPSLLFFEREKAGRDITICHELEGPTFQAYANFFNPAIKVTALKLPPRKSKDEIACQWEWKLEPSP